MARGPSLQQRQAHAQLPAHGALCLAPPLGVWRLACVLEPAGLHAEVFAMRPQRPCGGGRTPRHRGDRSYYSGHRDRACGRHSASRTAFSRIRPSAALEVARSALAAAIYRSGKSAAPSDPLVRPHTTDDKSAYLRYFNESNRVSLVNLS
jgi:hypothetical protein